MVKIIRSKRKTISIHIDDFGLVSVRAPLFVKDSEINEFIASKKAWIDKILSKIDKVNIEYCEIFNKTKCLYLGNIVDYSENYVKTIKNLAKGYLSDRLRLISNQIGLPFNNVIVKKYKSRWGSCDKNKNISLNYKLIMLDENLIDYVLIHELCHTVYFNHKKQFHLLLKRHIKNESETRKRLKSFSFINNIDY